MNGEELSEAELKQESMAFTAMWDMLHGDSVWVKLVASNPDIDLLPAFKEAWIAGRASAWVECATKGCPTSEDMKEAVEQHGRCECSPHPSGRKLIAKCSWSVVERCPKCKGVTNAPSEDIEVLAAAEHASWSGWMRYMHERMRRELEADLIPLTGRAMAVMQAFDNLPCIKRWTRQMATTYAELPEEEKESDRKEAREKLKVYRP